jgi:hypothetical protein
LEDLKLWKNTFLPSMASGMNINLITYRRPSFLCWSDACPEGLGGFDHMGHAWRFKIPEEYREAVKNKNNCLEFIASIVTVWQTMIQKRSEEEECFLSMGDNSSSVGCLPLFLATRKFAEIIMNSKSCIYSQHIPGISNTIADTLSRRFDLNDDQLTKFLNLSPTPQVQSSYRLSPVHPEINSWMICWLQKCNEMKGTQKIQKKRKREYGEDGLIIQDQSDLTVIGAFAAALRRREFSKPNEKSLVASTFQEAVAKLGEIFGSNVGYNPTHGVGSQSLHPLLTRQFKGMWNLDPGEKQQKALPVTVYRELHRQAQESKLLLDEVIAWLQTMAYFWCMRSCEYSDVQGERRTKILCVRNFRFFDKLN